MAFLSSCLDFTTSTSWRCSRLFEAKGYFRSRASRYPNSTSTFQLIRLNVSGDIILNPRPSNFKLQSHNMKASNVKIAHLNVRSLKSREHFILVKDTMLANRFDVFTVSETWLDSTVTNLELEIPGYDIYRIDRDSKKGGGVCVYVLHSYKTEILRDISNISSNGLHQLWIKLQVRNLKLIIICTIYRPPDVPVTCFDTDLTPGFSDHCLFTE